MRRKMSSRNHKSFQSTYFKKEELSVQFKTRFSFLSVTCGCRWLASQPIMSNSNWAKIYKNSLSGHVSFTSCSPMSPKKYGREFSISIPKSVSRGQNNVGPHRNYKDVCKQPRYPLFTCGTNHVTDERCMLGNVVFLDYFVRNLVRKSRVIF